METFVILRHPVAILGTAFKNNNKLTNDLIVFKFIYKNNDPHVMVTMMVMEMLPS